MITKENFKCKRCGECCHGIVVLLDSDIKRFEKAGIKDYSMKNPMEGDELVLRNENGRCAFLGEDNLCKIYSIRPEGCRMWPFVGVEEREDCKPSVLGVFRR